MTVIQEANSTVAMFVPAMRSTSAGKYRLLRYCTVVAVPEGQLYYNGLTGEMIRVDEGENAEEYMISRLYLVPEAQDDQRLCDELRNILNLYAQNQVKGITHYTILPTTDCNARCFYCYEAGCEKLTMDEKTAHDTASYILQHLPKQKSSETLLKSGGNSDPEEEDTGTNAAARILWFGGEPLCRIPAIDIISSDLQAAKCSYESTMISNGYLMDAQTARKAVDLWHLRSVQITLDGTAPVYNKRKAYVNRDPNAFERVIGNIHALIAAGVTVQVRMNMDENNYEDLRCLANELKEGFTETERKKLSVYSHYIFQEEQSDDTEKRARTLRQHEQLNEYLVQSGMMSRARLPRGLRLNGCMSDNPESLVILPDGRLHSCQHFVENEIWGSIYTGETKLSRCYPSAQNEGAPVTPLEYWRERDVPPLCGECGHYPQCARLKHCPDLPKPCARQTVEKKTERLRSQMLEKYESWKAGQCKA